MAVEVEAYAGGSYPERPIRVRWQGAWRRVLEVSHQYQEPGRRCFLVRLASARRGRDDTRLRLCYHYANDAWSAEPIL